MSNFEPIKILNRILNRLCQIDRFGYFALPVTEAEAPGYSAVIEKPMCFSLMREKIDAHQYRTWGAFLSDFNLMLRNALYFNDKKSVVYRIALLLNKEGNERLKEVDVEGRQAIYLLHPGGPAAAAEEEAREFEERELPAPMNPFMIVPSEAPRAQRSALDWDEEMDDAGYGGEISDEGGYSSFSETESESDMRGQGCPSIMKMQTTLNEAIEVGVKYETWKEPLWQESLEGSAVGFDWTEKKARLEWQCKWLQLRMKDLESRLEHYRGMDHGEEETMAFRMPRSAVTDLHLPLCQDEAQTESPLPSIYDYDSGDEETYPSRVYLDLGILAEETAKLTALLTARQRISQSRMLSAVRTTKKSSAPRKKPSSSTELLEPKRSRRDFEHALHHSDSFGASGAIEKPLKLNIAVPGIIEITPEKAEKWENAKRMLKQSLEHDPDATMPQEVMQALQLSADEGSSEEDISDDIYLTKHQHMELEERERHLCVLGGLDPKRRQLTEKRTMRSSYPANKVAAKRGRNRGRNGNRPVGRPPHLHHPDLPDTASPEWLSSFPMTLSSTACPYPPFPLTSSLPFCTSPDVTSASVASAASSLPATTTSI